MPTEFQAGWCSACEEIDYRLRTELTPHCLPPMGFDNEVHAPNEKDVVSSSPASLAVQEQTTVLGDQVRWALAAFNRAKREYHADDSAAMLAAMLAARLIGNPPSTKPAQAADGGRANTPRLLTREEVHAALPAPTNDRREFKGATCVQMTWHHFNQWAENIQRKYAEVNGTDGVNTPEGKQR